jgi:hypothetical protein
MGVWRSLPQWECSLLMNRYRIDNLLTGGGCTRPSWTRNFGGESRESTRRRKDDLKIMKIWWVFKNKFRFYMNIRKRLRKYCFINFVIYLPYFRRTFWNILTNFAVRWRCLQDASPPPPTVCTLSSTCAIVATVNGWIVESKKFCSPAYWSFLTWISSWSFFLLQMVFFLITVTLSVGNLLLHYNLNLLYQNQRSE